MRATTERLGVGECLSHRRDAESAGENAEKRTESIECFRRLKGGGSQDWLPHKGE